MSQTDWSRECLVSHRVLGRCRPNPVGTNTINIHPYRSSNHPKRRKHHFFRVLVPISESQRNKMPKTQRCIRLDWGHIQNSWDPSKSIQNSGIVENCGLPRFPSSRPIDWPVATKSSFWGSWSVRAGVRVIRAEGAGVAAGKDGAIGA